MMGTGIIDEVVSPALFQEGTIWAESWRPRGDQAWAAFLFVLCVAPVIPDADDKF